MIYVKSKGLRGYDHNSQDTEEPVQLSLMDKIELRPKKIPYIYELPLDIYDFYLSKPQVEPLSLNASKHKVEPWEIGLVSWECLNKPPKKVSDVFYLGWGFKDRHQLDIALRQYKKFGYSIIIEKSEKTRGRYQLLCSNTSWLIRWET